MLSTFILMVTSLAVSTAAMPWSKIPTNGYHNKSNGYWPTNKINQAQAENFCRITSNLGCTASFAGDYPIKLQCDDDAWQGLTTTFPVSVKDIDGNRGCRKEGYVMSDDHAVCCDEDAINGGYCPTTKELRKIGFTKKTDWVEPQMQKVWEYEQGNIAIKCNKRGGPHYCVNEGENGCDDEGMYD